MSSPIMVIPILWVGRAKGHDEDCGRESFGAPRQDILFIPFFKDCLFGPSLSVFFAGNRIADSPGICC